MGIENRGSCLQRDSAEREGYVRAHRSFRWTWKERGSAQPELLEKILHKDNLRENQKELIERIRGGKYTPDPKGKSVSRTGVHPCSRNGLFKSNKTGF